MNNILIVDDNEIALEVLRGTLEQAGYQVTLATNGRDALEIVLSGACRMVVTDWDMPEMNGLELCRAIRNSDLQGYIYLILLTAHDRIDEKVTGLGTGADDFICKPFNPKELIARVHSAERVLSLETREVAVFAMAKLAESRDPETGAHLERVRSYCRILAQQLAQKDAFRDIVNGEYIRLIYQTSPLHDIGKVGIPDTVLLKPGRLSDREFEIMKTHTTIGAATLDAAVKQFPGVDFLEMGRDIAASHHERFSGGGYPTGIAGKDIPLSSRIVALADVYDALTSRRVYKPAFAHDIAKSMITSESGSHFDPEVVSAFHQCEARFLAVREHYSDTRNEAA